MEATIGYFELVKEEPTLNRVLGNAKEIRDERGRHIAKDLSKSLPSKVQGSPFPKKKVLLEDSSLPKEEASRKSNKFYTAAKWMIGGVLVFVGGIAIASLASKYGWFKGTIAEKTIEKVGKIANDSKMVQGLYKLCHLRQPSSTISFGR